MQDVAEKKIDRLSNMQCCHLTSDNRAFNSEQINNHAKQLNPRWHVNNDNSISHTFHFKNYYQTIAFVNILAQIAHQQDHHPELEVSYNRCTVTYSTHSVAGLSLNDFICAAKINNAQQL